MIKSLAFTSPVVLINTQQGETYSAEGGIVISVLFEGQPSVEFLNSPEFQIRLLELIGHEGLSLATRLRDRGDGWTVVL